MSGFLSNIDFLRNTYLLCRRVEFEVDICTRTLTGYISVFSLSHTLDLGHAVEEKLPLITSFKHPTISLGSLTWQHSLGGQRGSDFKSHSNFPFFFSRSALL